MKSITTLLAAFAIIFTVAACATPESGTRVADTQSVEQPEEGFDGHERLAEEVVPTRYRLALDLDPTRDTFSGTTSIQVELAEEAGRIDLHAKDLEIDRVWANVGKAKIDASIVEGTNGGITVVLDSPIGPGEATLEFEYQAPLDETPHGLYRVEEGGKWYAFTQFEPLSAREAFPSFDEPRFKTPFQVSIEVPAGDQKAFANTLPKNIAEEDGTTYVYEETEPLPTYLVAFAVGPLEVVEAPEDAIDGVPLRVITTQGKSHLAAYALDKAPALLAAQTDYFGMELPFSKLDLVAVPNFAAGAMENVGLVTFRERLLLLDPDNATASDEYAAQSVMAHEFAHMWFGNYVTPAWWNDLWLNEAFATWMATRTLAEVAPELEPRIDAVRGSLRVMSADALENARAIRQPIRDGGDVYNAFDGITYSKGRAVLQMLEAWIGEEAFRDGVRRFMEQHAYGTGTTDGLISTWEEVSDEPIKAMLGGFLDQPGVPLVEVEPSCEDGQNTLEVAQSRYLPAGSDADPDQRWRIPVCFGFEVDGQVERRCELIEEASQTAEFDTQSCPTWIHPNADETGYYHWKLPADDLVELGSTHRDELSMPERVALLPHTKALVEAHRFDIDAYLELVEAMAKEEHRAIVGQVVDAVSGVEEIARDQERGEAFENWAAEIILPHAWRLGFEAKDGEPVEDRLLRPKVIRAAATLIPNDELRLEAVEAAE
ncbi:MAG: M1 family metallopeptidase, partial [Persicimonas sp.]